LETLCVNADLWHLSADWFRFPLIGYAYPLIGIAYPLIGISYPLIGYTYPLINNLPRQLLWLSVFRTQKPACQRSKREIFKKVLTDGSFHFELD